MSPRPMNLQQERHNTSLDPFPLPALICFGSFLWGFWFKETIDASQVKMSVLSLTSCLHFESMIFLFLFCLILELHLDNCFLSLFSMPGSRVQKVGTMPDSPADVKTQPRSTPPTMPPPPPAVSQATNRNASFTPTTSKSSKYLIYL